MFGLKRNGWVFMMMGLVIALMLACAKPQTKEESGGDQTDSNKPEAIKSEAKPYELVSTQFVISQASNSASEQTVSWHQDQPEIGLMLVLKLNGKESRVYYSSDFSLGYEDEAGIPRGACLGISMGVMQADRVNESTWMLGGAMSRCWANQEKPYFGILFSVPRKLRQVTLYLANPIMNDIVLKAGGGNT